MLQGTPSRPKPFARKARPRSPEAQGTATLMNILGGNLRPDQGSMKLRGEPYEPKHSSEAAKAGIAFIHQELNLFPNLSVADNLFIGNFPKAGPFIRQTEKKRKTKEWLDALKLEFSPD